MEILACLDQIILVTGGIQSGKSILAAVKLKIEYIQDLHRNPPFPGQVREYWVVADRIEDTVYEWGHILNFFTVDGLVGKSSSDPPQMTLKDGLGTVIKCKFSRDESKLSGVSPLGILICEAGNVHFRAYEQLVGRLAGYDAWMLVSGTFERNKHPWFEAKYLEFLPGFDNARSFRLPASSNLQLYPLGAKDPKLIKLKKRSTDRFYTERIEGIPAPPEGIVYAEFDPKVHIIRDYEYQPDQTLHLWHDPGYNHVCALLFAQYYGGMVYVFDEIYMRNMTTDAIIEIAQSRPWWTNPDKRLVVDPSYKNVHHSTKSISEIWSEKAGLAANGKRHGIPEGIDRVKNSLKINPETGLPGVVFHTRCRGCFSEFGVVGRPPNGEISPYVWKVDSDGYIVGRVPIDKNNDAMGALRYGLTDLFGFVRQPWSPQTDYYARVSTPETRQDYDRHLGWKPEGEIEEDADRHSTPDSRGDYGWGNYGGSTEYEAENQHVASTPESRGDVLPW